MKVGIILSVILTIESIILLLFVSIEMLNKKKIAIFYPFVFIGIIFSIGASISFFSSLDYVSLNFIGIVWFISTLWIIINLQRQKWH